MNELAHKPFAVKAPLNFAADTTDGGIWSNEDRSLITQDLLSHEVTVQDARTLAQPPAIAREGFELHHAPIAGRHWTDPEWIKHVYIPHSMALLKEATGAAHVAPMGVSVLLRDTGNPKAAAAAEFVHIDQDRASGNSFLSLMANPEDAKKYERATIFNIWRPITPPPQDVALAISDMRTLDEKDWVVGRTVMATIPKGVPYLSSVFNTNQKWYYFSDLTPDDAILFKNYDSDEALPLGCLHGAFKLPDCPSTAVPRASVELRLFAFF